MSERSGPLDNKVRERSEIIVPTAPAPVLVDTPTSTATSGLQGPCTTRATVCCVVKQRKTKGKN